MRARPQLATSDVAAARGLGATEVNCDDIRQAKLAAEPHLNRPTRLIVIGCLALAASCGHPGKSRPKNEPQAHPSGRPTITAANDLSNFEPDPGKSVLLSTRTGRGNAQLALRPSRAGITVLLACVGAGPNMSFNLASGSLRSSVKCDGQLERNGFRFDSVGVLTIELVAAPDQRWRVAVESP
jgi:hypothetical protein